MDNQPIVVDPLIQIDEQTLQRALMRWLLFISFKRAFENFKQFTQQPTFLGSILLLFLFSPSAIVFHLFFNVIGLGFRDTFVCSLCTPFVLLIILFVVYLQFSESLRHFFFVRMINFTFPENYSAIATNKSLDFASPLVVVYALKSKDPMIKLYGLKQLQRTCCGTPMQRIPLYSLSQPEQFQAELQPRKVICLPFFVEALLLKASRLFFYLFHSPILGAYETLCALLAIKVLSRTIIHSIEEDRFGVVQKDLKLCISKLTRLSIAIDAYVRARGRSATPSNINQFNVHLLDVELASALKDIRTVFAPYIELNGVLPKSVRVIAFASVDKDFRPQYKLANELPLCLFDCTFADGQLDWQFDRGTICSIIEILQKIWAEHQVKAANIRQMLEGLGGMINIKMENGETSKENNVKGLDEFIRNGPTPKLYGLKQLQRTCCGTPMQRIPLYSLSQPGEHPRNWLALREVSVQLIQDVIYHLQQQTKFHCVGVGGRKAAIAEFIEKDGSFSTTPTENVSPTIVLNELYEGRRSLFMPPALKPRSAEQFQAELQPRKVIRLPFFVEALLLKASRLFFYLFHSPILGAYETLCALLAIKVLSRTIIHSIEEDRFGVVQKDLKLCISKLTRLSIAIDAYVRARGRSATPSNINQFNVHLLDVELASALKDIRTVFAPYIDDLNLHPTEAEVFRMLV
uniref:Uncharacterized protein n=1 Tax=Meloidogyne incognita TaxID=6306 RepID=A0A914LGA9_MELIC